MKSNDKSVNFILQQKVGCLILTGPYWIINFNLSYLRIYLSHSLEFTKYKKKTTLGFGC